MNEDASAVAAAGIPASARLVLPQPDSRPIPGQSPFAVAASPLRVLYRLVAQYFPVILLVTIVIAGFVIWHNGAQDHAWQDGARLLGQQTRNALTLGAIYALVAVGYTMVYGIIELINFAHGDVFTLSGFYAYLIASLFGLNALATGSLIGLLVSLVVVFTLSMLGAGLTGMAIERVAYRRLRDSPRLAPLITAIGMSFLLEGIMLVKFGPGNFGTGNATWISGQVFTVDGVTIGTKDIFVVGMALVLMFALGAFVTRTRLGKAMRSTAQDRAAALLCGININGTISATFFIGSALAAAGAIIYSINFGDISWNLGFHLGIIAFTAAVLGGIGNIVGAGVGGFLIGIIYVFGGSIAGGEWSESLIFAILVIILTFRPVGLFGVDVTQRA